MTTATNPNTVDACTIVPRDHHPLIFGTFASLAPGEALLRGPDVWRVRIGRVAASCA